jgi:hypothetical protein
MLDFKMSKEQITTAKAVAKLVQKHMDGVRLHESLKIGEQLLLGRKMAMIAVGLDPNTNSKPNGKQYAAAFREWKDKFEFPKGDKAENIYDAAIVCAQHKEIAEKVIASLTANQRVEMGVFGLAKRVRACLKPEPAAHKKLFSVGIKLTADQMASIDEAISIARELGGGKDEASDADALVYICEQYLNAGPGGQYLGKAA